MRPIGGLVLEHITLEAKRPIGMPTSSDPGKQGEQWPMKALATRSQRLGKRRFPRHTDPV
jgi:hypothetical protein